MRSSKPSPLTVIAAGALAFVTLVPLSSNQAATGKCAPVPPPDPFAEIYPAHQMSPAQAFEAYDTVFHAEVAVPNRPCRLGFCAGLKVLRRLKGELPATVLLKTMRAGENPCGPANFNHKGSRWLVYADRGTSPGGLTYLYAGDEGPSFPSTHSPDVGKLEASYRAMRSRLDGAIEERLGPRATLRAQAADTQTP